LSTAVRAQPKRVDDVRRHPKGAFVLAISLVTQFLQYAVDHVKAMNRHDGIERALRLTGAGRQISAESGRTEWIGMNSRMTWTGRQSMADCLQRGCRPTGIVYGCFGSTRLPERGCGQKADFGNCCERNAVFDVFLRRASVSKSCHEDPNISCYSWGRQTGMSDGFHEWASEFRGCLVTNKQLWQLPRMEWCVIWIR
jgi:hypothetical protein